MKSTRTETRTVISFLRRWLNGNGIRHSVCWHYSRVSFPETLCLCMIHMNVSMLVFCSYLSVNHYVPLDPVVDRGFKGANKSVLLL